MRNSISTHPSSARGFSLAGDAFVFAILTLGSNERLTSMSGREKTFVVSSTLPPEESDPDSIGDRSPVKGLMVPMVPRVAARTATEAFFVLWTRTRQRLAPLGVFTGGNDVTVYTDGREAFAEMERAIDEAEHFVWLETYIYETDRTGDRIRDALTRAAVRGCDVIVLVDAVGAPGVDRYYFEALCAAGGRLVIFNPLRLWRGGPWWLRDHRKMLIVDGVAGFAGGMNIGDEYAGPEPALPQFRDTHARFTGPVVHDLIQVFLDSLRTTGAELPPTPVLDALPTDDSRIRAQVLRSNVHRNRRHIQRGMRVAMSRSIRRIWLTTPYFIPPVALIRALVRARRRGVDVRVLTAGISDVPFARAASQHIYGILLVSGVRIFELNHSVLHAKTAVFDGIYTSVGSFNLDRWSARRNLEVNVAMMDAQVARRFEEDFISDLNDATEVFLARWQRRSWVERIWHRLAWILARL